MDIVERVILGHKAYIGVGPEGVPDPPDNLFCTCEASGKNEVAYEQAFLCKSFLYCQVAYLSFHLRDGKAGEMRITLSDRSVRELCRDLRAPVFKVREIDVHKPIEELKGFNAFVRIRVIDERYVDPLSFRLADGEGYKGNIRRRADKVDIVAAFLLKPKEYLSEFFHREGTPDPLMAYLVVLAKEASQVAGREEYVPGAVRP